VTFRAPRLEEAAEAAEASGRRSGSGVHVGGRAIRRPRLPSGLTLVVVLLLVAFFSLIFVLPVVQAFWYSLNNYDIMTGASRWVGSRYYERLLTDPEFWTGLRVAVMFTAIVLVVGLGLQLALAVVLTTMRGRHRTLLLTLFFLPAVLPNLAVILIWRAMYRVDFGLLDIAAVTLGLQPLPWLSDGTLALLSIVIITIWKFLGYGAVIFMAGIHEIPDELYEAAAIDGAGRVRQTFSISLPLIRPLLLLQVVASIITLLQFFDPFYALTYGGPSGQTQTLILYIYNTSFLRQNFSYAAAMTTVLFLVLLVVSAIQLWLGRGHLTGERAR
jgi:ABC-type sugar transport system permease subunit